MADESLALAPIDPPKCPLAYGESGQRFDVPPSAVGWRVVKRGDPQKGGRPAIIRRGGVPLVLPLQSDGADLQRIAGWGVFELQPVDDQERPVGALKALVELCPDPVEQSAPPSPTAPAAVASGDIVGLLQSQVQSAHAALVDTCRLLAATCSEVLRGRPQPDILPAHAAAAAQQQPPQLAPAPAPAAPQVAATEGLNVGKAIGDLADIARAAKDAITLFKPGAAGAKNGAAAPPLPTGEGSSS